MLSLVRGSGGMLSDVSRCGRPAGAPRRTEVIDAPARERPDLWVTASASESAFSPGEAFELTATVGSRGGVATSAPGTYNNRACVEAARGAGFRHQVRDWLETCACSARKPTTWVRVRTWWRASPTRPATAATRSRRRCGDRPPTPARLGCRARCRGAVAGIAVRYGRVGRRVGSHDSVRAVGVVGGSRGSGSGSRAGPWFPGRFPWWRWTTRAGEWRRAG